VLTGTIDEYYEKTELKSITDYYFISGNHPLPEPANVSCAEANGEAYEGVVVRVNNATCTDDNYQANFYMWTVNDGTSDLLIHNTSIFEYEPTEGETYQITGPVDYDFDEWKIHLRFETDVQSGVDILPPEVVSLGIVQQTDNVIKIEFNEDVEETSAETAGNYSINNDVTVDSVKVHSLIKSQVFVYTSPMNGSDYELTIQNVEDMNGNAMDPTVIPFTSTGIDDVNFEDVAKIYPNPSSGNLRMDWLSTEKGNVEVNIINLTGKRVYREEFYLNGKSAINIQPDELSAGMYLLEVIGEGFAVRTKLLIQ
jgi:hypothetical protein